MTDKELKTLHQFVETSGAILVSLIEDLAPIIGYDEANRLLDMYMDAQTDVRGDTK